MRLLAPDELREDQRSAFDSYRALLPAGAVCVNVMVGSEPWDVRPLLLQGNHVVLYRFSQGLSDVQLSNYRAELEGLTALSFVSARVERSGGARQLVIVRPYEPTTLAEQLGKGEVTPGVHNLQAIQGLIRSVRELRSRNLVHGHICVENAVLSGGAIKLLDPLIGAINGTRGPSVAPELVPGQDVHHPSDLFGLGLVISTLLGEPSVALQRDVVRRLVGAAAKQRPSLEEVEEAFGVGSSGDGAVTRSAGAAGKVVRRSDAKSASNRETRARDEDAPTKNREVAPARRSAFPFFASVILALVGAGYVLRIRYPQTYFDLARFVPVLAPERSEAFEREWASGDKVRMLAVARAAVLEHNPAAENAIIDSVMSGETPPNTSPTLMRVALSDMWRSSLSRTDTDAVLALTVAPLFPQGLEQISSLSALNPGVILAVAAQMPPSNPGEQLKRLHLTIFTALPDPIGGVFRQLGELGVSSAGAPEAIGLANIIAGNASPAAFDALMGADMSPKNVIAKISIVLPIISGNEAAASQLLTSLRDREGDFGQVLSWFDIDDLAKWSRLPSQDKLLILLNRLPQDDAKDSKVGLSQAQYADLLTFPLPGIREQAAAKLRERYFKEQDTNLLLTLSGPGNRLSREQTVALVSALTLNAQKSVPFIGAWFGLKPSPDTVLLLLLARSGYDTSDTFNLEAARYLRRTQWNATADELRLMAQHPEPLARTLAYARLDPKDDTQKKILQERVSTERDKGLLKMVTAKLSADLSAPPPLPAVQASPAPAETGITTPLVR